MRMKEVRAEIERLKQTRQLSYLKIGQGIGYTDNGVWNFIKGPNKLSIDNADKILNLFGKELRIVDKH